MPKGIGYRKGVKVSNTRKTKKPKSVKVKPGEKRKK